MIITGRNDEEHLANLEEVLWRLQHRGLRANKAKCEFFKEKITYCRYDIDSNGLHKSAEKVEAVLKAPCPNDVAKVRSFLGLINDYHRFLPNLSMAVHPLHQLLKKIHKWKWTKQCHEAFHKVKEVITSEKVLTHYDPSLPLTRIEEKYAQIDKEASSLEGQEVSCIFVQVLVLPVYRSLAINVTLSSAEKHPCCHCSSTSTLCFVPGRLWLHNWIQNTKVQSNADGLSCLPLEAEIRNEEVVDPVGVFNLLQFNPLPVTVDSVSKGWPYNHVPELNPFFMRRDEITLQSACLMWGIRVIIPPKLHPQVLKDLH